MKTMRHLALTLSLGLLLAAACGRSGAVEASPAAGPEDAAAQYALGECYYHGKTLEQNYEEAVKWFRLAADKGYADAQHALGICYYFGNGVEKDHARAVFYFRAAAEQGLAGAQTDLGLRYLNGEGVGKDEAEAAKWFEKAGRAGNLTGATNLALCYLNGLGVARDQAEAVRLLRTAADRGFAAAQHNLGLCYLGGHGVDQNYEKAIAWFRLSIQNGYVDPSGNLAKALSQHAREREYAKWVADKGIEISGHDGNWSTLAHRAVSDNRQDILVWLKAKGAKLNEQDLDGMTPVDLAQQANSRDILQWFKTQGISPRDMEAEAAWMRDMRTAGVDNRDIRYDALSLMCQAAGTGDIRMLDAMLRTGMEVSASLRDGSTPLHFAVHGRNEKAIRWLKKHGADLGAKDQRGFTPGDYAAFRNDREVQAWLE